MSNTIIVRCTEDACAGDAAYKLVVDGVIVSASTSCTAAVGSGGTPAQSNSFVGTWPTTSTHSIVITYLNDYSTGCDRNLFIPSVTLDGTPATGTTDPAGSTNGYRGAVAGGWAFYTGGSLTWTSVIPPTTTLSSGYFPAATCIGSTGGSNLTLPATGAPVLNCTTNPEGTLDFSSGNTAQISYLLPSNWAAPIDARVLFSDASTSGTVNWSISTACSAVGGTSSANTTFNPASNFGTTTLASPANAVWSASATGIDTTGCVAGNPILLQLKRESDTATGPARLQGIELTIRKTV